MTSRPGDAARPACRAASALATALLGTALAAALGGCATTEDVGLGTAALERAVAEVYPPDDVGTSVEVACDGGLAPDVGATQECRVGIGRQRAWVRATVTSAGADGPRFETVPVVPSARVARTVLDGLAAEEYAVTVVVCDHELLGVAGERVSCAATPAAGGAEVPVTARVRAVDGLDVAIRYRVGG